jgi:hypothetical protein
MLIISPYGQLGPSPGARRVDISSTDSSMIWHYVLTYSHVIEEFEGF